MKFSLFADFHHSPGFVPLAGEEQLEFIQKRAESEGADFIIHAGDFCHGASFVQDMVKKYNDFHIPSYHCMGNHDTDKTSLDETLKLYNMPNCYYFFDCKGYRFIVFDPNYIKTENGYVHFELRNYFQPGTDGYHIPEEQLDWIEKTIESSPFPCVLIGHESIERPYSIKNPHLLRNIINEANRRKEHSVILVINGHHHRDSINVVDGVCYFEINSTTEDWLSRRHDAFPPELVKQYLNLPFMTVFNDPIHAIVTLEGNTITIEGMQTTYYMGIDETKTGVETTDGDGRKCVPFVSSAKISL